MITRTVDSRQIKGDETEAKTRAQLFLWKELRPRLLLLCGKGAFCGNCINSVCALNASGGANEALQLDLQTVNVRWFAPGDEFSFVGPGIVERPSEGGTTAQVSMVNGNIVIDAGSLPF